jgi:hypothetical protein
MSNETTTTNTQDNTSSLTDDALASALLQLRQHKPSELHHLKAGLAYYENLKIAPAPAPARKAMFTGVLGFNIFLDESLPADVIEARTKDGRCSPDFAWVHRHDRPIRYGARVLQGGAGVARRRDTPFSCDRRRNQSSH